MVEFLWQYAALSNIILVFLVIELSWSKNTRDVIRNQSPITSAAGLFLLMIFWPLAAPIIILSYIVKFLEIIIGDK